MNEGLKDMEHFLLRNDEKIWGGLDLFTHIGTDASTLANDVFSQMMGECSDEHSFLLETYLQRQGYMDKSFTFCMFKNDQGELVGACWQTAAMRSNDVLFGNYISFDMMKRNLHDHHWPYCAITAKNEFNKVVVLIEGVIIEEKEKAYELMSKCLFGMCPSRPSSDYLCISADVFF